MPHPSRRSFLAVAGSGAVMTAAVSAAATADAAETPDSSTRFGAQPLVAHVRDAASGTIVLYVGTSEVVVRDRDLVRRLTRAARR